MEPIYEFIDRAGEFAGGKVGETWNWFNGLNKEEWMVTLAIGATAGFVCLMLGMGNRK